MRRSQVPKSEKSSWHLNMERNQGSQYGMIPGISICGTRGELRNYNSGRFQETRPGQVFWCFHGAQQKLFFLPQVVPYAKYWKETKKYTCNSERMNISQ
ncbi:hypothetical protein Bpfe_021018 [Biomphalaria pfeifferi]|uniref:Uncharacterized protein n=1 Tax=Biomphalaria pfeifferi TaxID=112525 RepID=A0AAD8B7H5_BIOPF|nr:hypothetical protein Bpfe_021018 [Biomphalaria pfeifferi]